MRPIVFVGHDAARTGPPIYLLHLLTWIRHHHPEVPVEVVLLRGGPLVHRFRALAPTTVLGWYERGNDLAPLAGLSRHPGRHRWLSRQLERVGTWRIRRKLRAVKPGLVYFNCASAIKAWNGLPWRAPKISHVHELHLGLIAELDETQRRRFLSADRVFVVSSPVKRLVRTCGVAADRLAEHSEMIEVPADRSLHQHGDGPLIVGSCGTVDWRKAFDLFVRLVWSLRRSHPDLDVRFRWIGGDADAIADAEQLAADAGVADQIDWIGQVEDAPRAIHEFDVFVLTAREDAFPLVCLEAAAAGVPIVCFDTGGAADLAQAGAGIVTRYPDVEAMTEQVAGLCRSARDRTQLGTNGAHHVQANHSVEVLAPRVWSEIARLRR